MEELIAELKKLRATPERDYFGIILDGWRVQLEMQTKNGKTRYEFPSTGKKFTSAKNAAHYIIAEHIPDLQRLDAMRAVSDKAGEGLPDGARVWMMSDGELRISAKDAAQLRDVLRHLAARLDA